MATAVSAPVRHASWNPFRCGGTALPVNLLAMCKALAIALLITHHFTQLPTPFLPFIPGLDSIPPLLFQRTLQTVFVTAALTLLFNRSVRLSAFLLGATMLAGVLASRAYYGNNKTFCGLILVLTGLYERGRDPMALRLQLVLVYLGAGLNKLLDPDWQSGLFFNFWAVSRVRHPLYLALDRMLPHLFLARALSWFTIATELGLSVAFLAPRFFPAGIWLSLTLHAGMLLFTGSTFNLFFYGMTASMLIFANWPAAPVLVLYDGDCGLCARTKRWMERFDLEGMFRWRAYQSGAGLAFGISEADSSRRLYLINDTRIYSGFGAFRMMVLWNPISYLLTYVILAAPGPGDSRFRSGFVLILLLAFSPITTPIADGIYSLIARNRRRLSPAGNCRVSRPL
jgi:predicted DCC family thiol-disulfide oxidoreductase YuxK